MATKSQKQISKDYHLSCDEQVFQSADFAQKKAIIEHGLMVRGVEALEKMAANHHQLLDDIERYRNAYRDQKNRAERLEKELIQERRVKSRFRNDCDRLKAELQEKQISL